MSLAYLSLSENLAEALNTIVAVPYDSSASEHAQSTSRQATSTGSTSNRITNTTRAAIVKPLIGASEALRETFLGVRHSINPNARLEMQDKYKPPS
jgi:autophagy-related protein 2